MTGTQQILLLFQGISVDSLRFSKNMIIQSINSVDIFAFVVLLYYVYHITLNLKNSTSNDSKHPCLITKDE